MSGLGEIRSLASDRLPAVLCYASVFICGVFARRLLPPTKQNGKVSATQTSLRLWTGPALLVCAIVLLAWFGLRAGWGLTSGHASTSSTGLNSLAAKWDDLANRAQSIYVKHELADLDPIDAHTHITNTGPAFVGMLDELNMHVLDILYVDDTTSHRGPLQQQRQAASIFIASSHGRAALCTTIDPTNINDANFAQQAIDSLNQDFANRAVAAKVWKNIGMEFKNSAGQYIMPDDPVLEPVYRDIAQHGKTLIIHAADPDRAWDPYAKYVYREGYYESHPQWDMTKLSDPPQKAEILKARDRVVSDNPDLRVVAAHFGSLAEHLDDLAFLLDRYPNLAIDLAGRISSLSTNQRDRVRAFILRYQNRILYGTDLTFSAGQVDKKTADTWFATYVQDWRYLATGETLEISGQRVEGLDLPRPVLKKLYHDNAIRWIPGIMGNPKH